MRHVLAGLVVLWGCSSSEAGDGTAGVGGNEAGAGGSQTGVGGSAQGGSGGAGRDAASTGAGGGVGGGSAGQAGEAGPPIGIEGLIPADRVTTWQPGIPGGIPERTALCATLDAATYGNGTGDAAGAIQQAIDACPEGQVVKLGAGTFKTSATLVLNKGVVLRGAGSTAGGHPATTINRSPAGRVIQIGNVQMTSNADAGTGVDLTADAPNGATTVSVANASGFKQGDIVHIDQVDDATVLNSPPYDCTYFKRAADRSIGQRIEVASVSGTTLTLSSPLHWTFTKALKAQVAPIMQPITKNAGLEGVRISGGSHPYDGAGVDVWNAAYSWIRDIETDTPAGMHIVLSGTYRFVVQGSYAHDSGNYGYGTGCYGIVIRFQGADNLVENNIVYHVNKPILFNASGGGNVVAYNYADFSWSTPSSWQEVSIDCHCNFPHMELIEGNWAPHIGMSVTHGNAGFLTVFRNYASSQFHGVTGQNGNVEAIQLDTQAQSMNVVGNVLGQAGLAGAQYEAVSNGADCGKPHMYMLASGYQTNGCTWSPDPASDPALTTLLRHGNFDYVNNDTLWDPKQPSHAIPSSLYLTGKPVFWPAATPWPWTGPDVTPKVGVLPAKDRFDKMP